MILSITFPPRALILCHSKTHLPNGRTEIPHPLTLKSISPLYAFASLKFESSVNTEFRLFVAPSRSSGVHSSARSLQPRLMNKLFVTPARHPCSSPHLTSPHRVWVFTSSSSSSSQYCFSLLLSVSLAKRCVQSSANHTIQTSPEINKAKLVRGKSR